MTIQVQPRLAEAAEWSAYAADKNLRYELLEPSMPAHLDDAAWLDRAAAQYALEGRCASLHGAFIDINPASGDLEIRRASIARIEQSCAAAVRLGAGNIVFHSSAHPFLGGGYLVSWADRCADCFGEAAEKYGLRILIENSMDVYPDALCLLMERCPEAVGVCLDIGHAFYSRAPLREWFEALGTRIRYLHLSDNDGRMDDHAPLGTGRIDWFTADMLSRTFARVDTVTVEMNSLPDTRASLDFLRRNRLFGA